MAAQSTRTFPVASGSCGVPATAVAYSINVTVIPHGPLRYITLWPAGQPIPSTDTMASFSGQILSNAAIVPVGTNGSINVFATDTTDLIFDLNGYFTSPTASTTQSTALGTGSSNAGAQNTAVGFDALQVNSGSANTAVGAGALSSNSSGSNNVGIGPGALGFNAMGSANTSVGTQSLLNNLIGNDNAALGFSALWSNTTGINNAAMGANASFSNTSGSNNTAAGNSALYENTYGSGNVAIGYQAGYQVSNGSYNIDIGSQGTSTDSNTIRIGSSPDQTSAFITGIYGVNISVGSQVLINSNGQLGTIQSSRRYKKDIHDMADASNGLMRLRPVTFRYKRTAEGAESPLQYGLIAEEVADVYPELVVYGPDGQMDSVQYHEFPALLLNEVQKQYKLLQREEKELEEQQDQILTLKALVSKLQSALSESKAPSVSNRE